MLQFEWNCKICFHVFWRRQWYANNKNIFGEANVIEVIIMVETLTAVLVALQQLDIKSTATNMDKLLGSMQAIERVINQLNEENKDG